MAVRVTFTYEPDAPDPEHESGISEDEYLALTDLLSQIGAEDVQTEPV